uniref:Uncharacterized protein n=1 Tax=Timema genevievae TaxID=629358 RepID=A0A7R9JUT6_TIMGE|nr:unnamed protein product [Timema genevievae]
MTVLLSDENNSQVQFEQALLTRATLHSTNLLQEAQLDWTATLKTLRKTRSSAKVEWRHPLTNLTFIRR